MKRDLANAWISTPAEEALVRRIDREIRWERFAVIFAILAIGTGLVACFVHLLGGK